MDRRGDEKYAAAEPLVGGKVGIWVRDVDKPPPAALRLRRGGEVFWLYYLVSRKR
jgi:hypothetical protein